MPWIISDSKIALRISFFGLMASEPKAVTDSNPTSNRMAIVDWNITLVKLCGSRMDGTVAA